MAEHGVQSGVPQSLTPHMLTRQEALTPRAHMALHTLEFVDHDQESTRES